ncbi:alpha-hydroxy acid oxidase [Ketobacter sp.]|uniref:alpha-hydroxy acid oxidase n=1 Tax=Ketobacter sp. TaxID=2083498 RepID=UPI000F1E5C2C|nr:alpha-hydroxy acid oxidase [Ketobacter sp.]RLU00618.1 MAG: alpha-hydroxy-acid oxidizing protein [Ketobacter sp.]
MSNPDSNINGSTRPKLQGVPAALACVADYERLAAEFVDHPIFEYLQGGSGNEQSLRDNLRVFDECYVQNRLLADVSQGGTHTTLLQHRLRHPILLAPVAYQRLAHPEGELEAARGADALEAGWVTSTLSSCSLEDIAAQHQGMRWFQLYFQPQRAHTLDLVRRAQAAGYSAIVVTLDATVQASSRRAQRAGFAFPKGVSAVNLQGYAAPPQVALTPEQSVILQGAMAEAPTWQDLEWLLDNTDLPVLVKGVQRVADAERLLRLGVQGLVASNHGGRALDGMPAPLRVLPQLRQALGKQVPILLDSGIRSGYDVFKALALGADAVLIGRPFLYGLAVAGALGVAHVLRLLRDELELCMALAGTPTVADIGPDSVFRLD